MLSRHLIYVSFSSANTQLTGRTRLLSPVPPAASQQPSPSAQPAIPVEEFIVHFERITGQYGVTNEDTLANNISLMQ